MEGYNFNINNKDIKKANFLIEILKSEQNLHLYNY